jgi:hypothetical protein
VKYIALFIDDAAVVPLLAIVTQDTELSGKCLDRSVLIFTKNAQRQEQGMLGGLFGVVGVFARA